VTDALLGPYRIVQKLAAGGMGEVFLCEDPRLGRRVALKRVGGGWNDTDAGRDRLRREARAAAALNHPRIAAVYDVLETEAGPHLVMEYVEGETLSTLLRRERLTVERTLQIALELTEAIAAAHDAGIVHRDLKPSNVMIARDGHVKVLDFGLAKLRAPDPASRPLTGSGMSLGTPGYSAPEQLLGQKADHRSDIYSLGAILYEMCAGRPAFDGAEATAFSAAITTRVTPPSQWNPSVPRPVDELICRALSPSPDKRPQSLHEVRTILSAAFAAIGDARTTSAAAGGSSGIPLLRFSPAMAALAIVLIVAMAGVAAYLRWGRAAPVTLPGEGAQGPVVAVLPLENLSANPEHEYVAAGIADSLITDLTGLPGIIVLSRAAVREVGGERDITKAARQLGATYVFHGTVQHAVDNMRVNLRLAGADGGQLWTRAFVGPSEDLFGLQRRLAEAASEPLRVSLTEAQRDRLGRRPTKHVSALAAYWRGRDLLERTEAPGSAAAAVKAFEEAVELDSGFALAHAGLAEAAWVSYNQTKDTEWVDRALAASSRAVDLDAGQPLVWISRAQVLRGLGRHEEALRDLEQALKLEPADPDALQRKGRLLSDLGRREEAIEVLREAIAVRPGYWGNYDALGGVYYFLGRREEAVQMFERVIELQPDSLRGHTNLGAVYQALGQQERALESYRTAVKIAPVWQAYANIGVILRDRGEHEAALASLQEAAKLAPNHASVRLNIGDTWQRLGNAEKARAAYAEAVALMRRDLEVNPNHSPTMGLLAVLLAKLGERREAAQLIARALAADPRNHNLHYRAAVVHALSAQPDAALDALEQALALGYSRALVPNDQDLQSLHGNPRFTRMLASTDAAGQRRP
jgi:eukaryotic-like serine/threonine-protein kinase